MRRLAENLRRSADVAWEHDLKDVSTQLHQLARDVEALVREGDQTEFESGRYAEFPDDFA